MGFSLKQIGSHIAEAGSVATLTTALTYVIGRLGAHIFSVVPTASIAASTVLVSRFTDSYFPNISTDELDENSEKIIQNRWKQRAASTFVIALGIASFTAKFVLKQPIFDIKGVLILSALITAVKYACHAIYDKVTEIREKRKISQKNEELLKEKNKQLESEKEFLISLDANNIDSLIPDDISKIHLENIQFIPLSIVPELNKTQINAFTKEQFKEFTEDQKKLFTEKQLKWRNKKDKEIDDNI